MSDADTEKVYPALGAATEFWAVVGRGAFAFRFGPYTGPEVGAIVNQALAEKIAVTIVGVCGREFDWDLARDLGVRAELPGEAEG